MKRPGRVHDRSKRLFQAVWVAVYALGLLLSTAHFSLVPHRVCEHGDVAHVEAGALAHCESGIDAAHELELAAEPHAELGGARVEALASAASDAPAPEEEEGHEHCELDPATQAAPAFELSPLSFAHWLEECFGPVAEPAPRAPRIAVLRLAPGHSPPRA